MDENQNLPVNSETPDLETPLQEQLLQIQEQLKSSQAELEKARLEKETAEKEITELKKESLRRNLCVREGLSENLIRYVSGEDEESLLDAIHQVQKDFAASNSSHTGGISLQPGKQQKNPDPETLSPMQKILMGLSVRK